MNMKNLYKVLLVASLLLYALVFLTRYFGNFFYDAGTLDALSRNGYAAIIANHDWASYTALFLYALTTIGLLFFRPWARLVFVILTAASLLMALFIGVDVKTPLESTLYSLIDMMAGAIIALMYFTDLRYKFDGRRNIISSDDH